MKAHFRLLTAITGDDLANAVVTYPTTLGDQAPNLSIDRNISSGIQVTTCGVSSSDNTVSVVLSPPCRSELQRRVFAP